MRNRSKRKPVSVQKKHDHRAPANQQIFQMLVNSINETWEEDLLVRMLLQSQIG